MNLIKGVCLISFIFSSIFLMSCNDNVTDYMDDYEPTIPDSVKINSAEKAYSLYQEGAKILDFSAINKYEQEHIKGATHLFGIENLKSQLDNFNTSKTYLLFSKEMRDSLNKAWKIMNKNNFQEVYILKFNTLVDWEGPTESASSNISNTISIPDSIRINSTEKAYSLYQKGAEVLDFSAINKYEQEHIKGAMHLFSLEDLQNNLDSLNSSTTYLLFSKEVADSLDKAWKIMNENNFSPSYILEFNSLVNWEGATEADSSKSL